MRSDITKKGSQRSAHRSLFHAMGYTNEELQRPMIGVVNSFNEIVPGHMHLREIADAVKMGVAEAGGMPVEFPAIAICDGIAMGHDGMKYPLASRELIADSIEAVANGHAFDGLVNVLVQGIAAVGGDDDVSRDGFDASQFHFKVNAGIVSFFAVAGKGSDDFLVRIDDDVADEG